MSLTYIRRGRPWAVVVGFHNETECGPWHPFRSVEVTVYPRRGGRIGRRRTVQRGRFWLTGMLSWGMCEVHAGFDKRRRIR